MTIYLDFDGTLVEHQYPKMGRCNFGCIEVLEKLHKAGHAFILNTYRSELSKESLQEAHDWLEGSWRCLKDRSNCDTFDTDFLKMPSTSHKIHPDTWDIKKAIETGVMYIDDIASDIPLKRAVMTSGNMVDWDTLDKQFQEHKIY